jgi:hypothetical protein
MHPWIAFVRKHKWWGVIGLVIVLAAFWYWGGPFLVFFLVAAASAMALWFTNRRREAGIVLAVAIIFCLGAWWYSAHKANQADKAKTNAAVTATAKPPAPPQITPPVAETNNGWWSNKWKETKDFFSGAPKEAGSLKDKVSLTPKNGPGDSAYRDKHPLPKKGAKKPSASANLGKQSDDDAGADTAAPIERRSPPPIEIEPISGSPSNLKFRLLGPCHFSDDPNEVKCPAYVAISTPDPQDTQDIWLVTVTGKIGREIPEKDFVYASLKFDHGNDHTKLLPHSRSDFYFTFKTVPSDMAAVTTFELVYCLDGWTKHSVIFQNAIAPK